MKSTTSLPVPVMHALRRCGVPPTPRPFPRLTPACSLSPPGLVLRALSTMHVLRLVFPLPHQSAVCPVIGGPCRVLLSVACIGLLLGWFDPKLIYVLGMVVRDSGNASGVSGGDGMFFKFQWLCTVFSKSFLLFINVWIMNKDFLCRNKATLAMDVVVLATVWVDGSHWVWPVDADVTVTPCWMGLIYVRLWACWMEVVWVCCEFVLIPVDGNNVVLWVCFSEGVVTYGPRWVVMSTTRCCCWAVRPMVLAWVVFTKAGLLLVFWGCCLCGVGLRLLNKAIMALGGTVIAMVCMGCVGLIWRSVGGTSLLGFVCKIMTLGLWDDVCRNRSPRYILRVYLRCLYTRSCFPLRSCGVSVSRSCLPTVFNVQGCSGVQDNADGLDDGVRARSAVLGRHSCYPLFVCLARWKIVVGCFSFAFVSCSCNKAAHRLAINVRLL